jgi:hypothetical protein
VPLPNIGKSGDSPKGYTTKVTIQGKSVAIQGATFGSMGDVASKGTGGGLVSANTHGPTKFVGPGSMDVKFEGKNVQLLTDPMLNNCGGGGSPPNAATMLGIIQPGGAVVAVEAGVCPICGKTHDALAESPQSKTDAGALAKAFKAEFAKAEALVKAADATAKVSANTMLGVVECQCGKKYADQSAMTTKELANAADSSGMKHPPGECSYADGRHELDASYERKLVAVRERMAAHLGNSPAFQDAWAAAAERARQSDANRSGPASYPPGTCAAQSALLLLMDDGALPKAMTEEWFSSGGSKTQAAVKYIDAQSGARVEKTEKFKPGTTVPPCGACEVLVPMLMCPGGKLACTHGS